MAIPENPTEFEIQSFLANKLAEMGFLIRGEYKRLDVAVWAPDEPGGLESGIEGLCVGIEVKKNKYDRIQAECQLATYSRKFSGAPITLVSGTMQAYYFIFHCRALVPIFGHYHAMIHTSEIFRDHFDSNEDEKSLEATLNGSLNLAKTRKESLSCE